MSAPDRIWSNGKTNGALGDCWMECATEEMPGREIEYTRADLAPQWQDIATAPKDGSLFLGFYDGWQCTMIYDRGGK